MTDFWRSDRNIFDSPDLTVKRHVSLNDEGYSFDERIVAKHKNGRWFTAHSSGCSCPVPFEEFQKLEDLTRVGLTASYRAPTEADGYTFKRYMIAVRNHDRPRARAFMVQVRTSWDELVAEAEGVLAWTRGTDTDRFYGTPPSESTIADYVKWLKRTRAAERRKRYGA